MSDELSGRAVVEIETEVDADVGVNVSSIEEGGWRGSHVK